MADGDRVVRILIRAEVAVKAPTKSQLSVGVVAYACRVNQMDVPMLITMHAARSIIKVQQQTIGLVGFFLLLSSDDDEDVEDDMVVEKIDMVGRKGGCVELFQSNKLEKK